MAIRVEHGPSMVPVGRLAYRTGQNEYINRRRRELEALREQQASRQQDAAMHISDINAGFQRLHMQNTADQQKMQQNQEFQQQMMQAGQQFDQEQAQQQNEWLTERVQLGHENAVNIAQMGNQFDLDRMEREYELDDQAAAKEIRQAKRAKRQQERWGKYNTETKDLIGSLQQQKKDIKKSSELNDEQKQEALDGINQELKEIESAVPGDGSDYFKDAHLQAGYYGVDPHDPRRHIHNKDDGQGGYEQIITYNLDKEDGTRYGSVTEMMIDTGMAGSGRTKDGQDYQYQEGLDGNPQIVFGDTAADRQAKKDAHDQSVIQNQIARQQADTQRAQQNQEHLAAAHKSFYDAPEDMIVDPNDPNNEIPSGTRNGLTYQQHMSKFGNQEVSTDLPRAEDGMFVIELSDYTEEQLRQIYADHPGQKIRAFNRGEKVGDFYLPGKPKDKEDPRVALTNQFINQAEGIDGMPVEVVLKGLGGFMDPLNRQGGQAGPAMQQLQKIPGGEHLTADFIANASQKEMLNELLSIAKENGASPEILQDIMKKAEKHGVQNQLVPQDAPAPPAAPPAPAAPAPEPEQQGMFDGVKNVFGQLKPLKPLKKLRPLRGFE